MTYVAFDTETTLIANREYVFSLSGVWHEGYQDHRLTGDSVVANEPPKRRRIYMTPFVPPELVCGSVAGQLPCRPATRWEGGQVLREQAMVMSPEEFIPVLAAALQSPDTHTIWHNIAFDYAVLTRHDPRLRALFLDAAAAGRVHDTMYLDILVRLARGDFDQPAFREGKWQVEQVVPRSLETLVEACGLPYSLVKDERRLQFGEYLGRVGRLPPGMLQYAAADAMATLDVFLSLSAGGLYGEPTQVRAALACADMDQRGVRIDRELAGKLAELFERDLLPIQRRVAAAGLGVWEAVPKTTASERAPRNSDARNTDWEPSDDGKTVTRVRVYKNHQMTQCATAKFCLKEDALRNELSKLDIGKEPIPKTPTGLVSLDADFWARYTPPTSGLQSWLEYERLSTILGTYLRLYSRVSRVFPRWNVLRARSGRMSASSPNLQNVPKRRHGIRALFLPSTGCQFAVCDYSCMELLTLAEAMVHMGIRGPLLEAIQARVDLHRYTAGEVMLHVPLDAVTKPQRQHAKAVNFGVPGGLGPKKLRDYAASTFNVEMSLNEAREARGRFLSHFHDVAEFLERHKGPCKETADVVREILFRRGRPDAVQLSDWDLRDMLRLSEAREDQALYNQLEHTLTVDLTTGRRRAGCRYTEACNTRFQGLAADVTKEALFLAARRGLRLALVVHDEIVIEAPPAEIEQAAAALKECMIEAFVTTCPHVGPYAEVELTYPLDRWGPATDADGKEVPLDQFVSATS